MKNTKNDKGLRVKATKQVKFLYPKSKYVVHYHLIDALQSGQSLIISGADETDKGAWQRRLTRVFSCHYGGLKKSGLRVRQTKDGKMAVEKL